MDRSKQAEKQWCCFLPVVNVLFSFLNVSHRQFIEMIDQIFQSAIVSWPNGQQNFILFLGRY